MDVYIMDNGYTGNPSFVLFEIYGKKKEDVYEWAGVTAEFFSFSFFPQKNLNHEQWANAGNEEHKQKKII